MRICNRLCQSWVAISICAMCAVLCLAGCTPPSVQQSYFGLGSVLTTVTFGDDPALSNYCRDLIEDIREAVDVTDPDSDIARFNAAQDEEMVEVSHLTYVMVQEARRCYDLTNGLYDPTAYWSVDLWGFLPRASDASMPYDRPMQADGGYALPRADYVEAFRHLTDMRRIEAVNVEDREFYLVKHDSATVVDGVTYYARLDLGGIAKGYAVSCINGYLEPRHIAKGYFSFGASSLLLLGNRKGSAWDLSLTHPRKSGTYFTLPAKDVVVSTSGDYQNYYIVDDMRYCHIIDPRTGCPIQSDMMTVSVLGEDATLVDALSTALMVDGIDNLRAFAQSEAAKEHLLRFVAVYMDEDEEKVFCSPDLTDVSIHY